MNPVRDRLPTSRGDQATRPDAPQAITRPVALAFTSVTACGLTSGAFRKNRNTITHASLAGLP
jgi:hypothetical protein